MEKTKVTIVTPDGTARVFTGDTVLVFTVSDIDAFFKKKGPRINASSVYAGNDIPIVIFAEIIADLIDSFIQGHWKANPAIAAFNAYKVAVNLLECSQRILDDCTREQLETELSRIKESLSNIMKIEK